MPLIVSALAVGLLFLTGPLTGRIFPWGLGVFFGGMVILALLATVEGFARSVVASGILLGIGYRAHINLLTTPVGASPQGQPGQMDAIVSTGRISTGSPWYDEAPLHFVYGAAQAVTTGLSAYDAIVIYSGLIPVLVALVTLSLAHIAGVRDRRALAVAVLLALVTTEGIRRSYWIVPQVTGTLIFWSTLPLAARHVRRPSSRVLGVIVVAWIALAFTHKLPLVFLTTICAVALLLVLVDGLAFSSSLRPERFAGIASLFAVAGTLSVLQITGVGLLRTILRRSGRIIVGLLGRGSSPVASEPPPRGVVRARPGLFGEVFAYPTEFILFVERAHGIWLVAAAALGGLVLYLGTRGRTSRIPILFILSIVGTGVMTMLGGVVAVEGMNPTRPLFLIEPVLVVVTFAGIWVIRDRLPPPITVLTVLGVVLIATQVFAASAAPDYVNTPRYYADVPEAQAKDTFCNLSDGEVYVDAHFARFVDTDMENCPTFTSFGTTLPNPLFSASISPSSHPTVAIRENIDVYLGHQDRWRLTYDPVETLQPEYDVIYDNGAVTVLTTR